MSDRKEKEKGSFSKSGQNKDFARLLRILEAKFFRNNLSFLLSNCPCHVFKMLVFLNFSYHFVLLHCGVRSKSKSRAQWLRRRQE